MRRRYCGSCPEEVEDGWNYCPSCIEARYKDGPFYLEPRIGSGYSFTCEAAGGLELECYFAMQIRLSNFDETPSLNYWSWPVVYPTTIRIDA